jgi:hypothetical protein
MRISHIAIAGILAILAPVAAPAAGNDPPSTATLQQLHGIVVAVSGDVLTLRLRNGQNQNVDIGPAKAAHRTGVLPKGHAVVVYGSRDASGTFHVQSVGHASPSAQNWSPDS